MVSKGVDGVRDGKPPGARGGIQILGMVRGEWLRLAPQAYGGEAGCWVIAGTWPPPGGSCGSQFPRAGGFLEMISGLSPYSAQCLVRHWILEMTSWQ